MILPIFDTCHDKIINLRQQKINRTSNFYHARWMLKVSKSAAPSGFRALDFKDGAKNKKKLLFPFIFRGNLFFSNDKYDVSRKTGLVWIVIDLMLTIIQSGVAWIFFFLWHRNLIWQTNNTPRHVKTISIFHDSFFR